MHGPRPIRIRVVDGGVEALPVSPHDDIALLHLGEHDILGLQDALLNGFQPPPYLGHVVDDSRLLVRRRPQEHPPGAYTVNHERLGPRHRVDPNHGVALDVRGIPVSEIVEALLATFGHDAQAIRVAAAVSHPRVWSRCVLDPAVVGGLPLLWRHELVRLDVAEERG